nr:protein ALP1-like [Setaria viridis]XP_034591365.1 protein ALP1-like [Setaria viridis]
MTPSFCILSSNEHCIVLLDMDFQGRRRAAAALVAAVAAWFFLWFRRRSEDARSITYGPMAERDRERNSNLRFIYESDDVHCVNLLRMRRAPFFQLCDLFRSRELVVDSIHATVEEQVAMFLHVVGHNQRFRVINMTFRRSIETISRFFHQVLYAVGELRNELIVPPSTSVHPRILGSRRWNPYFKDCIGAIDGTHVLARVPLKMQAAFRGRKHTITQNVLAAVDFDLRFTYVLAGWEGSAHDALILSDALERTDGLTVPQGKFYLVDAGYAARPGFLPPYRGTRYHLREFGSNRPQNQRELFNLRHSSLRVTVERAFGALKNRFRILDNKPFHPYKTQVKLVLACCILHNWILSHGEDEHVPTEAAWTPNSTDTPPEPELSADNGTWAQQRDAWAAQMWQNRGSSRV